MVASETRPPLFEVRGKALIAGCGRSQCQQADLCQPLFLTYDLKRAIWGQIDWTEVGGCRESLEEMVDCIKGALSVLKIVDHLRIEKR